MRPKITGLAVPLLGAALLWTAACSKSHHATGLQIAYGPKGLERLAFDDTVLADLTQYPADAFHIWHLKLVDKRGQVLTGKEYDWGETNHGRLWDPAAHTWTYSFAWGSIRTRFVQHKDALELAVTETNNPDSGATLDGATIYPFVLHFPELPSGFGDAAYEHLAVRPQDPAPVADYGSGRITLAVNAASKPLYYGWEPAGNGNNFFPVISSTAMDSMSAHYDRIDRPVRPGQTDIFSVTLQFDRTDGGS